MKTTLMQLRRIHTKERMSLLNERHQERQELALKHRNRLQESIQINADPVIRSAALISNAQELTSFALKYLREWTEMEERHAREIALLIK